MRLTRTVEDTLYPTTAIGFFFNQWYYYKYKNINGNISRGAHSSRFHYENEYIFTDNNQPLTREYLLSQ